MNNLIFPTKYISEPYHTKSVLSWTSNPQMSSNWSEKARLDFFITLILKKFQAPKKRKNG